MEIIKCILKKDDDKTLKVKRDNLNIFLENMQPLESFSDVDAREYVDGFRGNSRVIGE